MTFFLRIHISYYQVSTKFRTASQSSSLLRGNWILRQHGSRVLIRQYLIVTARRAVVVDGIIVIGVNRQSRRKLPKGVIGNTGIQESRLLPRFADCRVIGNVSRAVLFEDDWLARYFACGVMLHDPLVTPGVIVAPRIGIEVESAVVEGGDGEVFDEVNALVPGVRIRAIAHWRGHPSLIAKSHHVLRI